MVRDDDLPSAESHEGMEEFMEQQRAKQQKIEDEQQKKADLLVTGFLQEKKRMEESDASIAAFEKRMAEKKKEQEKERKERRNDYQKKLDKRDAQITRCQVEQHEKQEEIERSLNERLKRANATRAQNLSTENLRSKIEASESKRANIFWKAIKLEEQRMAQIENKTRAVEERLEERRALIAEEYRQRNEASQAKFHEGQIRVYQEEERYVNEKLDMHAKFLETHKEHRDRRKVAIQQRTKTATDTMRKARDKWRGNHEKEMNVMREGHAKVLEKHASVPARLDTLAPLKVKNGQDVFSNTDVKYNTWGELQKRRQKELAKSRDAHTQALVFEIAELNAKVQAKKDSAAEMNKKRDQVSKEILTLNDRAREGFQRIKCEPDEKKIHQTMANLGFKMPKLPDEEEQEGEGK